MSRKFKRVLAIIALVFIGLFTVSFVAFLVDKTLFNGSIGFFALFTGAVGLALFFVIKLSRDNTDYAQNHDTSDESDNDKESKDDCGKSSADEEKDNSSDGGDVNASDLKRG